MQWRRWSRRCSQRTTTRGGISPSGWGSESAASTPLVASRTEPRGLFSTRESRALSRASARAVGRPRSTGPSPTSPPGSAHALDPPPRAAVALGAGRRATARRWPAARGGTAARGRPRRARGYGSGPASQGRPVADTSATSPAASCRARGARLGGRRGPEPRPLGARPVCDGARAGRARVAPRPPRPASGQRRDDERRRGANLVCLAAAREAAARRCGVDIGRDGVRALPAVRVYGSTQMHFTNVKALLGARAWDGLRRSLPVDGNYRLRPGRLESAIKADLDAGVLPLAASEQRGSPNTGASDPLRRDGGGLPAARSAGSTSMPRSARSSACANAPLRSSTESSWPTL